MKPHITLILSLSLSILIGLTGCVPTSKFVYDKDYIEANEKQWLEKAYRYDENGWIFLHIEGEPFERGFQRGYLTAGEIYEFLETLAYVEEFQTGKELDFFVKASAKLFKKKVSPEYVKEMQGMIAGMRRAGREVTFEQMLFMNGFIEILWYWWPEEKRANILCRPSCSAFIATGDTTADGRIVMAHNSWISYTDGRFCNIILDIVPNKGHRILMQSCGPCLYSVTDFFITSAGLMGTETTIGGFSGFNRKGTPVFERARKAMQYAYSIDDWARIMIKNNNGAYANSWLLGDTKTNEIGRLELGLKHHSLEKKTNGYFCGSNVADNIKILREETDATYDDIRNRAVARRIRWKQLMEEHTGSIDVQLAKQMLADHYDVYLQKEQPSSRTICGHFELDDGSIPGTRSAYSPAGAVDGKVVDSSLAEKWQFWARWASSCDIGFDAEDFLEKHPQYDWMKDYLKDLPAQPWTIFPRKKQ